jgi:hypothetical protein
MARTACLVCLVITVNGHCKNALGRGSTSNRHIKLEQSTFLWIYMVETQLAKQKEGGTSKRALAGERSIIKK